MYRFRDTGQKSRFLIPLRHDNHKGKLGSEFFSRRFFFSQPSQIPSQLGDISRFCKNNLFSYNSIALQTDRRTDGKAISVS